MDVVPGFDRRRGRWLAKSGRSLGSADGRSAESDPSCCSLHLEPDELLAREVRDRNAGRADGDAVEVGAGDVAPLAVDQGAHAGVELAAVPGADAREADLAVVEGKVQAALALDGGELD